MKNNNDLFYTCSLIEYIGREKKQKRSSVIAALGENNLKQIYSYADVFHCEPIANTADEFVGICGIEEGSFDNVSACEYEVPDYWTIGEVYARLIEDSLPNDVLPSEADVIVSKLIEVYSSWIDDAIQDYNTDFFYQPREYITACYEEGSVLE